MWQSHNHNAVPHRFNATNSLMLKEIKSLLCELWVLGKFESWKMEQYDVDSKTRQVFEERTKRRAALREQFLKLKTDPFQHASGEGGTVFDPALQRYQAMKVNGWDYFKPTGKNTLYGFVFMILPMGLYGYFLNKSRTETEAKYRRGEVAYKDRNFKFI